MKILMDIKISSFNINNIKVWITIQPLYSFAKGALEPTKDKGFICYFKFSPPFDFPDGELINYTEGELIRDDSKKPKIFEVEEEIELFAINYVKQRL